MFILILIVFILLVGLGLYMLTTMRFEVGDGFSEMKKNMKDIDYKIVEEDEGKKMLK